MVRHLKLSKYMHMYISED